jgi:hypothetical protein
MSFLRLIGDCFALLAMTCNSLHTKTPDGEAEGFLFFILSAIEGSACGRYFIRWFAFWASTKIVCYNAAIMRYERNGKGFLNIGLRGFIYEEIPGIAPVARR